MNNPTTLLIIVAILSCAAVVIISFVQSNRRKTAAQQMHNAARKLVKEQNLSKSLRNSDRTGEKDARFDRRMRMMIALEWKDKEKERYVFDPLEGIRIGRSPADNNAIVPDDEVSLRHCILYQNGRDLILEDLGSTNGTEVIHGLSRKRVKKRMRVYEGDRICIGNMQIRLHVFWIDTAHI